MPPASARRRGSRRNRRLQPLFVLPLLPLLPASLLFAHCAKPFTSGTRQQRYRAQSAPRALSTRRDLVAPPPYGARACRIPSRSVWGAAEAALGGAPAEKATRAMVAFPKGCERRRRAMPMAAALERERAVCRERSHPPLASQRLGRRGSAQSQPSALSRQGSSAGARAVREDGASSGATANAAEPFGQSAAVTRFQESRSRNTQRCKTFRPAPDRQTDRQNKAPPK